MFRIILILYKHLVYFFILSFFPLENQDRRDIRPPAPVDSSDTIFRYDWYIDCFEFLFFFSEVGVCANALNFSLDGTETVSGQVISMLVKFLVVSLNIFMQARG
jgi:hypothetical protein